MSVRFINLIKTKHQNSAELRLLEYLMFLQKETCFSVQIQGARRPECHSLVIQSRIIARLTKSIKFVSSHSTSNKKARSLIRKRAKMASQYTLVNVLIQGVHWKDNSYQNACTTITAAVLRKTVSAISEYSFIVKNQFTQ